MRNFSRVFFIVQIIISSLFNCSFAQNRDYILVNARVTGKVYERPDINHLHYICSDIGKSIQVKIKIVKCGEVSEEFTTTNEWCGFEGTKELIKLFKDELILIFVESDKEIIGYQAYGAHRILTWEEVNSASDTNETYNWETNLNIYLVPENDSLKTKIAKPPQE